MKPKSFKALFLVLFLFASITENIVAQQKPAVINLTAEKLHARVREWPYPVNGITVPTNARALLWPATNGKTTVLPMESGSGIQEDPKNGNTVIKVFCKEGKSIDIPLQKRLKSAGGDDWGKCS